MIHRGRSINPAHLLVLILVLAVAPAPSTAYTGTPPPSACGKTLVLGKAVPGTVRPPDGGSFDVATVIFFDLVDFPPGTGDCPAGPYEATVSVIARCLPPPGGLGVATASIMPGFNSVTVPVTLAAGPPRSCSLYGTVTVPLSDGTTLTAAGDSVACVAEPSLSAPTLPRLDLQIFDDVPVPGGGSFDHDLGQFVHPGDAASITFRITNNDPTESFSGELTVEMVNVARLPAISGPMAPGTGVYSVADPVTEEGFSFGVERERCRPLRLDSDGAANFDVFLVDIPAGESVDVAASSRPFGACANGCTGEATVTLEGKFSDSTPGSACGGLVVAADTSAPPAYVCSDAGEVARVWAGDFDRGSMVGRPTATSESRLDFTTTQVRLSVDGTPSAAVPLFHSDAVEPERLRNRIQFSDPLGFSVDSFFDVFVEIEVAPSAGQNFDTEMVSMTLISGAPTGFENVAPVGQGLIAVRQPGDFLIDSFFDIIYQISVVGIDETGSRRDFEYDQAGRMTRRPDGGGFEVQLLGGRVSPGPGSILTEIEINQDFRGFTSPEPQRLIGLIFTDGFESGDTAAWSRTVP